MEEFSPATASMLGLPWDFHEQCRAGLEADYLQPMYLHARSVARESAAAGLAGQDWGTCQACLALMCAILSWDFRWASHLPSLSAKLCQPVTALWVGHAFSSMCCLRLSGCPVFSTMTSHRCLSMPDPQSLQLHC